MEFGGVADEYKLPYFEHVANNPSLEDMERIVVFEKNRPEFSDGQKECLSEICDLASECWLAESDDRPTMLRVKKTLEKIKI